MLIFLEKMLFCFLPFLFGKALISLSENNLFYYLCFCMSFVLYFLLKCLNQNLERYSSTKEIKQAILYCLITIILSTFSFLYFHWTSMFSFFFTGIILNTFLILRRTHSNYQIELFANNFFNASCVLTTSISFWFMFNENISLDYCATSLMVTYLFSKVFFNKAIFNKIG
jgi:hypothetical protein